MMTAALQDQGTFRNLCADSGASLIRHPGEMKVLGTFADYAFIEVGHTGKPEKLFIFDTSRIAKGGNEAASKRFLRFLTDACELLGQDYSVITQGKIEQASAVTKIGNRVFKDGCFQD